AVFMPIYFIPGDPAMVLLGEGYTESRAEEIREQLGLNRPLVIQFIGLIGHAVQGDLGSSIFLRQEVAQLLFQRGLVTLTLAVLTMLVSIAIAIPLGVISAVRRDSWIDNVTRVVTMAGISMPVFVLTVTVPPDADTWMGL